MQIRMLCNRKARGFALGYILAFIALATIAVTFVAKTQRGMAIAQFNQENRNVVIEQYTLIRSRAIGCVVTYPTGNNGSGFRSAFPATPASTLVSDLTCPGQSGANNLWYGTGGLSLPATPPAFSSWKFVNDATSIRIMTSAISNNDPSVRGVMDSIVAKIGSATASRTGDTLTLILAL